MKPNIIKGHGDGPLTRRIKQVIQMEHKSQADDIEQKSVTFELKASETEKNVIEGYASTFGGEPDSYNDIVVKGAFAKTLQERGDQIKFLWQHDWNTPIGKVVSAVEDEKGLFIKVKISETDKGKETMMLVKDGALNQMSIGYRTIKGHYDNETGIRYITEVKLYEVSIVTFPANENAVVTGAKNANKFGGSFEDYTKSVIQEITSDIKAGRVISDKTRSAIVDAISGLEAAHTSLKTLLDSVDGTNDEDPKSGQNEDEQKQAADIAELTSLLDAFTSA
ncbi:HK97 family phage prohead protease [Staphylococcus aureus]|uniref:HK97 family phage prohead protease n=1 Tax=Staphylococcus aureus TaxID=1280 RepID=UPI00200B1204|nr:HK97 family phage prohead protease [Staphylococcus aureus]